jgi:hypothetical protein
MKILCTALALASIIATSAVAKNEKAGAFRAEAPNAVPCARFAMTDPDPRVRAELQRDCPHYNGN